MRSRPKRRRYCVDEPSAQIVMQMAKQTFSEKDCDIDALAADGSHVDLVTAMKVDVDEWLDAAFEFDVGADSIAAALHLPVEPRQPPHTRPNTVGTNNDTGADLLSIRPNARYPAAVEDEGSHRRSSAHLSAGSECPAQEQGIEVRALDAESTSVGAYKSAGGMSRSGTESDARQLLSSGKNLVKKAKPAQFSDTAREEPFTTGLCMVGWRLLEYDYSITS